MVNESKASPQHQLKALLVEKTPEDAKALMKILASANNGHAFDVSWVDKLELGLAQLSKYQFDVILLDLSLAGHKGLNAISRIRNLVAHATIVVLNNIHDDKMMVEAARQGAQDYIVKSEIDAKTFARLILYAIERKRTAEALHHTSDKHQRQNRVLEELAKRKILDSGDLRTAVMEVAEAAARTLGIERVSVWLFDDDRLKLHCINLFQTSTKTHSSGLEMLAMQYPTYFEALKGDRTVSINDVHNDSRTVEISKAYFAPIGVNSVLAMPVRLGSQMAGVVCYEHVGASKAWSSEEENFGDSIADLVSLALEAFEERRVNRLAYHDRLTDLPNQMLLMDRLNQAIIAARFYNQMVAVLFIDLDQLKRINATLGHASGDQLLQAVADRLRKTLYETDTVTRIGGDEFAILLPKIVRMQDVTRVTEKIFNAFSPSFNIATHEISINCNIGISIFPNDGEDAETLLNNANAAVSVAKEQGKNSYQFYSPAMNAHSLERLVMANDLRQAMQNQELRVYYQPVVDLETGRITGAEALVRWERPHVGLVSPAKFIPVAEETGLIVPIGEWVLRTACLQNKKWQVEGLPPINISVNVSPHQFYQANLPELVAKVLTESGLNPTNLKLEITETAIIQSPEQTIKALHELSAMGVKLSIDDFGKGYWPLSYLTSFPIDHLKIDLSFVQNVTQNPNDRAIVKAIISMAHSLKLEVVAEGVETEDQLEFFQRNNCDLIQGFLFSKPVPTDDFTKMLSEDKKLTLRKVKSSKASGTNGHGRKTVRSISARSAK